MKRLVDLCFVRPVAVTAFCTLLVLLAFAALLRLPVALLPDLRYPSVIVWTSYPNVPPDRVERSVTERVEEAIASTSGLLRLTSRSQLGGSLVRVDLDWNTDLDLALLDVREQIDRLSGSLPDEASRPIVLHIDPSQQPMMSIILRSTAEHHDLIAMKRLAREVVARRLEQLDGVARVRVTGGYEEKVDVVVIPDRLATFGIAIDEVREALRSANVSLPGGFIRHGPFRYTVEVSGEFRNVKDIAETVIGFNGGRAIRTRDVADVRRSVADRRGLVRLDGVEALLLLVERRPDANTVEAAKQVRESLGILANELPRMTLDVLVDDAKFIQQSISGITQAVVIGAVLAILVLLLFVRRVRPLLAVAVAIPLSLGIALVFFDLLNVSFNLISLSGLALGVGMLVDNAIIVVENIVRLREKGLPLREAGRRGTQEVATAITASTLTTIAVFLPITFVEGLAGRLFRDQSLAVVSALAASLLVALTVVPLIAVIRSKSKRVELAHVPTRAPRLLMVYEGALGWCLDHRTTVAIASIVLLALAALGAFRLPRQVLPATEPGRVALHLTLTSDADLPLVSVRADELERQAATWPEVKHVLADLGERDEARLDLDPRPPYEADLTLLIEEGRASAPIAAALTDLDIANDLAVEARPVKTQLEALLSRGKGDLLIDVVSEDRRDAESVADRLHRRLSDEPALTNLRRLGFARLPAFRVTFEQDAMARYGVPVSAITAQLEAAARGRRATDLRTVNESIPIVLRTRQLGSIEGLLAERIQTPSGPMPLHAFVDVDHVELPSDLIRTDQASIVRILADIAPDFDLRAGSAVVRSAFTEILPISVRGRLRGATDSFNDGLRALALSLSFSILLVYLILAAHFESLVQPLVILLAVPLAAAGVVLALWMTGQSVNLMSLTGCVVLVGIVVNDAIIKVDFINQRRAAGVQQRDAIMAAGRDRVRPILMTTVTTVFGLLPLALGFGNNAELRAPLAIAIVGGILSATFLTLLVVPVSYSVLVSGGTLPTRSSSRPTAP